MAKKNIDVTGPGVYRFCGNGQGIPGLPHEVTAAQAKELGLLEVLQAAIQNGNYTSATRVAEAADGGSTPPRLATPPPAPPQIETHDLERGERKE